ncbi:MAG TPA: phage tail protein [Fimbriimonadaceae bacterium]|nr:phage tail protein [Fimbriimonadaceae bacterium]
MHWSVEKVKDSSPKDPHLGMRFWVEIDGVEVAGFCECSGLTIETEVFEYVEGGWNVYTHKLPVRTKYSNITLKRGIDNSAGELFKWFEEGLQGAPKSRKNVTITIYGQEVNQQKKQWVLREAWPIKWTGPDLKADSGAVAIETLEFAHHGLQSMPTRT